MLKIINVLYIVDIIILFKYELCVLFVRSKVKIFSMVFFVDDIISILLFEYG